MGIEPPPRAQYIRVLFAEITRILNHLLERHAFALDVGAITPLLWGFEEREKLMEFYERVSGARLHAAYFRPGGVHQDLPAGLADDIIGFCEQFPQDDRRSRAAADREPHLQAAHRRYRRRQRRSRRSIGASPGRCCAARASPGICARRSPTTSMTRWISTFRSARTAIASTAISCASRRCASRCASSSRRSTQMPAGPVKVNDRKVAPPPRAEMKQSMEALIHHFKLYTEGYHVPAGETYTAVEAPKGEFGVYLVADGTNRPYRCKIRAPGFAFLQAHRFHVPGATCSPMSSRSSARWTSSSARSTDERRDGNDSAGRAAGELRVHAGKSREGQGAYRQISARPAGERGAAAARSGAAPARRLAAAGGDGPRRAACSTCRRSASTRSRPSTRCSTCGRSASICCRSARRRRAGCAARTRWSTACEQKLGDRHRRDHADGQFTLVEVECLGACVNAPIIQVNDDFYEDLDGPSTEALIDALRAASRRRRARSPGAKARRRTAADAR